MHLTRRGRLALTTAVVFAVAVGIGGWSVLRPHTAATPSSRTSSGSATALGQPTAKANGAGWVKRENAKPGSSAWKIDTKSLADDTQLAGYADHVRVRTGDPLRLFVTTTAPSFTVKAFRLGWYGGDKARLVWTSPSVPGRRQAAPVIDADRTVTTHWKPSTTVDTSGWPEGTYLLLLTDSRGLKKYVPVTVRSASVSGRLVLVNAVTTYQAYNQWGGHSLYGGPGNDFGTRSSRVSFDRPYDKNGARIATQYELPIVAEAEREDLPLAYLTSVDLDADPHALDGARGLVSLGHDEYWSVGMRRAVTNARDSGANLAFLGANSLYWRIRFEPSALGADRV
ncbi:MAG: N,N-dimethylformamidase beta subunit family domain-containing protein, partial [Dermatophilaceae bacterium]